VGLVDRSWHKDARKHPRLSYRGRNSPSQPTSPTCSACRRPDRGALWCISHGRARARRIPLLHSLTRQGEAVDRRWTGAFAPVDNSRPPTRSGDTIGRSGAASGRTVGPVCYARSTRTWRVKAVDLSALCGISPARGVSDTTTRLDRLGRALAAGSPRASRRYGENTSFDNPRRGPRTLRHNDAPAWPSQGARSGAGRPATELKRPHTQVRSTTSGRGVEGASCCLSLLIPRQDRGERHAQRGH
jgi:hypothetical protein